MLFVKPTFSFKRTLLYEWLPHLTIFPFQLWSSKYVLMLNLKKMQEYACAYENVGSYMQCLSHKIHLVWGQHRLQTNDCNLTLEELSYHCNYLKYVT